MNKVLLILLLQIPFFTLFRQSPELPQNANFNSVYHKSNDTFLYNDGLNRLIGGV